MDCSGNQERIDRYLDGEMLPEEQAQFEEHVARCPSCQREMAGMRALFATLEGLEAAPVPQGLRQEVLAGLDAGPVVSPLVRQIVAIQVIASALLLTLAYPTLASWYERASAWLGYGWLSRLTADAVDGGQDAWRSLIQAATVQVNLTWPQGLGLTWPQAALLAMALLSLWILGNHLLLATRSNGIGGRT
jgi:predicted anti-sigma-YlaC factor YlaD